MPQPVHNSKLTDTSPYTAYTPDDFRVMYLKGIDTGKLTPKEIKVREIFLREIQGLCNHQLVMSCDSVRLLQEGFDTTPMTRRNPTKTAEKIDAPTKWGGKGCTKTEVGWEDSLGRKLEYFPKLEKWLTRSVFFPNYCLDCDDYVYWNPR